jgi:riboflavin biosynthesis pyrimidine reductase
MTTTPTCAASSSPRSGTLNLLDERAGLPQFELPVELERLYGGGIGFDAPCVFANFVETIDGVVAIPELDRSNALIADGSDADKFVMGLLRACADVVLVGSGTVNASPQGTWRPERVYPAAAEAFAELRRVRERSDHPAVAIVTSGASLDRSHPILADATVLTTVRGADALHGVAPEVVAVNDGDSVDLAAAVTALHARGHGLILSEGGPTVFGELVANGCVDELFLTVSPLLAGRLGSGRLALVEGVELLPETAAPAELLSVRTEGDHLFLRYSLRTPAARR